MNKQIYKYSVVKLIDLLESCRRISQKHLYCHKLLGLYERHIAKSHYEAPKYVFHDPHRFRKGSVDFCLNAYEDNEPPGRKHKLHFIKQFSVSVVTQLPKHRMICKQGVDHHLWDKRAKFIVCYTYAKSLRYKLSQCIFFAAVWLQMLATDCRGLGVGYK